MDKQNKTKVIAFKVTEDLKSQLEYKATKLGLSVSAYLTMLITTNLD